MSTESETIFALHAVDRACCMYCRHLRRIVMITIVHHTRAVWYRLLMDSWYHIDRRCLIAFRFTSHGQGIIRDERQRPMQLPCMRCNRRRDVARSSRLFSLLTLETFLVRGPFDYKSANKLFDSLDGDTDTQGLTWPRRLSTKPWSWLQAGCLRSSSGC